MNSTENILSYWYDTEFFSPFWPIEDKNTVKITNLNSIKVLPWENDDNINKYTYDVFLGRVKSQNLIDKMRKALNIDDEYVDKDNSSCCLSSFQVDSYGRFILDSTCASSYVWAIAKVIKENSLEIQLEQSEIDKTTAQLNSIIDESLKNQDEENKIINHDDMIELFSHSLKCLNVSTDDVDFCVVINSKYIPQNSKKDTNNEEKIDEPDESIVESNMLSSFYVDDLALIKDNCNKKNNTIDRYTKALITPEGTKVEIDNDISKMKEVLSESNFPLGKWPSKHCPSLMQQIAINLSIKNNEHLDIFSVNGPPGTGKTTLLKEIIASNIVERAYLFAQYEYPDDAFKENKLIDQTDYLKSFYTPDDILVKYGIIVASNNNAAVENISKELPVANKVFSNECLTHLFDVQENDDIYFTAVANSLSNKDGNNPSWGLISARLGKSCNINDLKDALWFHKKNMTLREMYNQDLPCWEKEKTSFIEKYNEVKKLAQSITQDKEIFDEILVESDKVRQASSIFNGLKAKKQTVLNFLEKENENLVLLNNDKDAIEKNILKLEGLKLTRNQNIENFRSELNFPQKWFPWLFKKNKYLLQISYEQKEKAQVLIELSQKNIQAFEKKQVILEQESQIKLIQLSLNNIDNEIDASFIQLETVQKSYNDLLFKRDSLKKKYKNNFADEKFWEDIQKNRNSQIACPWTTKEYDKKREELFFRALMLQKAFVLNSQSVKNNINCLINLWSKKLSAEDKIKSYAALLNTLMFVIPVISTTFASVSRFLNGIGPKQLGTLVIDEAGQATPQSAVGAIWRCKKSIVVGDPLQVEPISTVAKEIRKRLAEKHGVNSLYRADEASVQTFADRLNSFGGYRKYNNTKMWLGCPLVVHRRCIDPMFTISNEIAYNGKMIGETKSPPENAHFSLGQSRWIDICGKEKGNKNHFVQEQADQVKKLVVKAFVDSKEEPPSLYVISPFTSVISELKTQLKLILCSSGLQQNTDVISDWVSKSCGTIHTFQGKEANEVIIVLGCDSNTGIGAAQWVGNKPNILNVAVSRAKFRCVIIGDKKLWSTINNVSTAIQLLNINE